MAQYGFGVGILSLYPPSTYTDQTPIICGVLQDVSLDISMTTKELRGSLQFPVDATRSAGSVTGKAKFAQISAATIGAIMNAEPTAGMTAAVINETKTPSGGTITYTVPGSGTFLAGVSVVSEAGVLMKKVTGSPVKGVSYTLSAGGVYGFAADEDPIAHSYTYTLASTGNTVAYDNQLMGAVTTFELNLHNNFKTKNYGFRLPAVIIPKLAFAPKQDDYLSMDVDFQAMAGGTSGLRVIEFYSTE